MGFLGFLFVLFIYLFLNKDYKRKVFLELGKKIYVNYTKEVSTIKGVLFFYKCAILDCTALILV